MFPTEMYVHTAAVQTYLGTGPNGDTFATTVNVPCFADDQQNVTVNGTSVAVTDATNLYADPSWLATLTPNSKVVVNGQSARVISVKRHLSGSLLLPDHLEVTIR